MEVFNYIYLSTSPCDVLVWTKTWLSENVLMSSFARMLMKFIELNVSLLHWTFASDRLSFPFVWICNNSRPLLKQFMLLEWRICLAGFKSVRIWYPPSTFLVFILSPVVDVQINFRVLDVCRYTENLENLYLIFLGVVAASDKFDLCSEWNLVRDFLAQFCVFPVSLHGWQRMVCLTRLDVNHHCNILKLPCAYTGML